MVQGSGVRPAGATGGKIRLPDQCVRLAARQTRHPRSPQQPGSASLRAMKCPTAHRS